MLCRSKAVVIFSFMVAVFTDQSRIFNPHIAHQSPLRHKRLLIHLHPGIVFKSFIDELRSSNHKALRRGVHMELQHLWGNSSLVIRNVYCMRFTARRLASFQQASANRDHQCYQLRACRRNDLLSGNKSIDAYGYHVLLQYADAKRYFKPLPHWLLFCKL
jgi:hypothetical protein